MGIRYLPHSQTTNTFCGCASLRSRCSGDARTWQKSPGSQGSTLGIERTVDELGTDFGDDTLACHARVEHLEKKGPEESGGGVNGLSQGFGIRSTGEEILREEGADQGGKIRQGEEAEVLDAPGKQAGLEGLALP